MIGRLAALTRRVRASRDKQLILSLGIEIKDRDAR